MYKTILGQLDHVDKTTFIGDRFVEESPTGYIYCYVWNIKSKIYERYGTTTSKKKAEKFINGEEVELLT